MSDEKNNVENENIENKTNEDVKEQKEKTLNEENVKQDGEAKEHHKKEHHKKKHEDEISKLEQMSKEEVIKEYMKVLNDYEKAKKITEEKEKESLEYLDRYRRGLAEIENVRKRASLEKQDILKYSNYNIVGDFLVILDDFQRAIDAAKTDNVDFENYKVGIEMIEKQFLDLLFKKYGVNKFGEKGEEFDPNKHSAMMMEEGEFDSEVITDVFRYGYSLHDRIIRPAQVKIGKPKN
ncbi:MAG: nucleotide exchange factor GrpE [Spirochaetes bacterium GWD1_27_9]|nr:MAG: nucleotide exchange factor GrpE [Spirochaetes bacterium GWC1_27_15]OHD32528.1 MAG: nucleotide exchange factor GrpE [Spirochaetes bacterium GWD1_27_9]